MERKTKQNKKLVRLPVVDHLILCLVVSSANGIEQLGPRQAYVIHIEWCHVYLGYPSRGRRP